MKVSEDYVHFSDYRILLTRPSTKINVKCRHILNKQLFVNRWKTKLPHSTAQIYANLTQLSPFHQPVRLKFAPNTIYDRYLNFHRETPPAFRILNFLQHAFISMVKRKWAQLHSRVVHRLKSDEVSNDRGNLCRCAYHFAMFDHPLQKNVPLFQKAGRSHVGAQFSLR